MKRIEDGTFARVKQSALLYGDNSPAPIAGRLCTVIKYAFRAANPVRGFVDNYWFVDISDRPISECQLEPINPDNESSSWEEVQNLTNWNPTRETA